jgi:glycosyltransferase involved in cell wall biosynthesis
VSDEPASESTDGGAAVARPRRRIAVVVQRWGAASIGGAEWHATQLIDCLRRHHDVTVLTSCARDAQTWAMALEPGTTVEAGEASLGALTVQRFEHPQRNAGGRAQVPLRHKLRHKLRMWLGGAADALGRVRVAMPVGDDRLDGHLFLRQQGPTCAGLIEALAQGAGRWDAVVFFTALYHPTAEGLPAWGPRSVLVPTLHDEKPMYLPCFHRVFASAGLTLFNTEAEAQLAQRLYGASVGESRVVGAPVTVSPPSAESINGLRLRLELPQRWLVYVGRIEKGKGCQELLDAWEAVAASVPGTALVFVGKGAMPITTSAHTRCTGFVSDADRDALIAGAAALVMPSRLESLSLVLLEALALGTPVLANGRSDVLAGHVAQSGAGQVYRGRRSLGLGLVRMLSLAEDARRRLGEAGRRYVEQRYARARVERAWLDAVEVVAAVATPRPPGASALAQPGPVGEVEQGLVA